MTASSNFYATDEWRDLREQVLALYGPNCMRCDRKSLKPHIDHIVPRSMDESLELEITNMQVLCKTCNCNFKQAQIMDFRTEEQFILLEESVGHSVKRLIEYKFPKKIKKHGRNSAIRRAHRAKIKAKKTATHEANRLAKLERRRIHEERLAGRMNTAEGQ